MPSELGAIRGKFQDHHLKMSLTMEWSNGGNFRSKERKNGANVFENKKDEEDKDELSLTPNNCSRGGPGGAL